MPFGVPADSRCGRANDELCICHYHGNLQPAVAAVLLFLHHTQTWLTHGYADAMLSLH